jgi:hypothetical protein
MEGFVTPRLPAAALVVGGLVAGLGQRHWLAAFCVAAAMSLHPIIGCAGAAMLILTFVAPRWPRLTVGAAAVVLVAGIAIVLAVSPLGRLEDAAWLFAVRMTSSYLFVGTWHASDWSRISVPLAILAVGALVGTAPLLRRTCLAALVMAVCGLLTTFIFADLLRVLLFISAQTWRWLWLANVVAFVLAPVIAADCWRRGDSGRIAILILVSAWIFRGTTPTLWLIPLALAAAAVPERWARHSNWRLIFLAASVMVGLAAVLDLVDRFFYLPASDPTVSALLQKVRFACGDGVILSALSTAAWLLLRRAESTAQVVAIAGVAALSCGALVPIGWGEWTNAHYTPALASRFEAWRSVIPPHAETLWPDTPVGSWYFLERPSYWSPHQSAGAIFSKDKAVLLQHRTEVIAKAIDTTGTNPSRKKTESVSSRWGAFGVPAGASRLNLKGMKSACADSDLSYIVSWLSVTPTPYPPVSVDDRKLHGKLYLYRCADLLH